MNEGVWAADVWANGVWFFNVWIEGGVEQEPQVDVGGALHKHNPNLSRWIKWYRKENPSKSITNKEVIEKLEKSGIILTSESLESDDEEAIIIILIHIE